MARRSQSGRRDASHRSHFAGAARRNGAQRLFQVARFEQACLKQHVNWKTAAASLVSSFVGRNNPPGALLFGGPHAAPPFARGPNELWAAQSKGLARVHGHKFMQMANAAAHLDLPDI